MNQNCECQKCSERANATADFDIDMISFESGMQGLSAHDLEQIYHIFYKMARFETNQKFMLQYEKISNFAINERARISPNYIQENYS